MEGEPMTPARLKAQIYRYKTKYAHIPEKDFVGKYGGAYKCSYPVDTRAHAIAALSYARHAPYPEGIRRAVYKRAKKMGWLRPDGTIKRY